MLCCMIFWCALPWLGLGIFLALACQRHKNIVQIRISTSFTILTNLANTFTKRFTTEKTPSTTLKPKRCIAPSPRPKRPPPQHIPPRRTPHTPRNRINHPNHSLYHSETRKNPRIIRHPHPSHLHALHRNSNKPSQHLTIMNFPRCYMDTICFVLVLAAKRIFR